MSDLSTFIRNAKLTSGVNPVKGNAPSQYADRNNPYFDAETRAFIQQTAKFSSDFVTAQVQGIDESDLTAWGEYRLRLADVVRPTAAIQRHFDDYKMVLFESAKVDYIRPGTKIVTMGSTWLATNPVNISGANGTGVVRRCNAVWNHLDYYGNVVSEPIVVENERANANDSDAQSSQIITKGYFNIICQYNDDTKQIDTNTRFILGAGAYRVTGYSDFETEFTGDYSTVRLLSFTARYEEPNETIDDMDNHVAGGLTFSWNITVNGATTIPTGNTTQLTAVSVRNGETVVTTDDYPISYVWSSSDESVLTVDGNGLVTAIGEGTAEITVSLYQNTACYTVMSFAVEDAGTGIYFTSTLPESVSAYDTVQISAAYFLDGEETDEALTWEFSGADSHSYTAEVADDGKSVEIVCYSYSDTALTVTVSYGDDEVSTSVTLEGI